MRVVFDWSASANLIAAAVPTSFTVLSEDEAGNNSVTSEHEKCESGVQFECFSKFDYSFFTNLIICTE
jgi:hypothetical protein